MGGVQPQRYLDRRSAPHISTLIFLTGVSAMSMNIFLPSLPAIARHFEIDYGYAQLIVAGYLAASGFLQLFIGPLADRYGRRPILLGGLSIFVCATLGCLAAPNFAIFISFRILQAAVVTALALTRAIVRDMNTPDRAAARMGYVTMGMSMVPMFAPAFGGLLDELFGWTAPFWLLLIAGSCALCLCWADLGETAVPSDKSVLGQFAEYPEILSSPRFWGYCMAAALCSGAFFAYLGGAPYIANEIYGLSPATFGMFNAATGTGYFLGNWTTGMIAQKLGMNRMILIGTLLVAAGMALSLALNLAGIGGHLAFFGTMVFVGFGNGMVNPSANAGMLSVRPHLAGTASGLGGAMMIGGGAALSAWAGTLLSPETGAAPLIILMMCCGLGGCASILAVMRRERRLALR